MPERIHKLQPNRTLALRGFDDRGAGASLHAATADSFKVSGVFRDEADFCVLILHDADNFYEHPRLRYLPDFDFSGIVLEFDVHYDGIQPLDTIKFPTIDNTFLDVIRPDGTTAKIRLFDHATQVGGTYSKAQTVISVSAGAVEAFDRVTIWYQNYAFDYIATGGETAEAVAAALGASINGTNFGGGQAIEAVVNGVNITIRAAKPGRDGNLISIYTQSKNERLKLSPETATLSGGKSDAVRRIRLDFSALGIDQIRQCWFTYAPQLGAGTSYQATEWVATYTNWTVTGDNKWLTVAGPGSVRIEENDSWCRYTGDSWSVETGFFSGGFARRASTAGDSVTVTYHCQHEHDLYVGTSLYVDRGVWGVSLDGDAETELNTYLSALSQVNTRRRVRQAVPAGKHSVTLRNISGLTYFDFIEAAVPGDVPDPPGQWRWMPACDYGTDHTYKLSPARLMWNLDMMGFAGEMNVYVSVFWWNQRKRVGETVPRAQIDFSQLDYQDGDGVFIRLSGQVFGKTVFPADTPASIARHFRFFIDSESVGVWATHSGSVLTITSRAVGAAYEFTLEVWRERGLASTAISHAGSLQGGVYGRWDVDPAITPAHNRGAREWLADLLAECAARQRGIVLAYSMEVLNPPDAWAARYPDGTAVTTATGFATNSTTHCAFGTGILDYQKRVYLETADLMAAAGVPILMQFGEFLWWFFAEHGGMAFYDAATQAAALAALGRPLYVFAAPDDDPSVNGYADAEFLAGRLHQHMAAIRDHVRATHPDARFEILLPLDVNYERPVGRYGLGGRLNHYVNIPASFRVPANAPFDAVKMEALDFGAGTRSLDLAKRAMRWPFAEAQWAREGSKYLVPIFNAGCPWPAELYEAITSGLGAVNLWAWDHIPLLNWPLGEPVRGESAQIL